MSQSQCDRLNDWSIRVVYLYTFILGQLPAPFDWKSQKFRPSRLYLCYSFAIQCVFVGISPLGTPLATSQEDQENSYMQGKPILVVTYYIGKFARVLTLLVLTIGIWLRRQQIIDLYQNYTDFKEKHEQFYLYQYLEQDMTHAATRQVKMYTVCKLVTCHINIFAISSMYFLMQPQLGKSLIRMIITNLVQSFHLAVANMYFYVILSKMHLHFRYINNMLEKMLRQGFSSEMLNGCWYLYSMHFECYQLSVRILDICQPVTLFTLIKVFTTNVIILYHAVLFVDGTIKSDGGDNFLGMLLIVVFYWDTMFTMTVIDNVVTSCNHTAEILGHFLNMSLENQAGGDKELSKMLSQFHEYLACHKLEFCIFGMFSLNMSTSLQYFIFALVHLIVLVQFDLKWRT